VAEGVSRVMVDFTQMRAFERDPLVLSRGEGIRVWDVEGKVYVDGVSGVMTMNLGYGNQAVIQAVTDQLQRLPLAAPTSATSDRMIEVTDRLLRLLPPGFGAIKLHSGGSESVEGAFKIARQFHRQAGSPGRYKVISRYGAYHGATMGALSATGYAAYKAPYEPLVPGFLHVAPPEPGHDHLARGCSCIEDFDRVIRAEDPSTVAAVVVEPVMTMAGVLLPPAGYLVGLREVCDRHGVLLIFDEIINGFGRLGAWFAAERFNTWPDLLVFGKGVTAGYAPLSGVVLSDRVAEAFSGAAEDHVQYLSGHTYGGNPVGCAAALATITQLEDHGIIDHVRELEPHLQGRLEALAARQPAVRGVRSIGFLACVDLPSQAAAAAVAREARELGLLTLPSTRAGVRLAPPLVSSAADLDEIVDILERAVASAARD
jgi:adenosylmethionine-8-amino-7-oxononanoate aminotransferase